MGKIDLEIFEDKFLKKYTAQYELSILLGVDSLCYAVSDQGGNLLGLRKYSYSFPLTGFRDLPEAAKEIFVQDNLLSKPFGKYRMAVFHPYVSLIPKRLYNEQEKEAYLEKLLALEKDDRLFADEMPFAAAVAIYPLTAPLLQEMGVLAPGMSIRHLASCLSQSLVSLQFLDIPNTLFFNLRGNLVQVFAFDKNELYLHNTYPFFDSNDLVYYLLLVCQQLSWKPENTGLYGAGLLIEDSAIFRHLQRFFPQLALLPLPGNHFSTGPRFEREARKHWFFDLLSIHW